MILTKVFLESKIKSKTESLNSFIKKHETILQKMKRKRDKVKRLQNRLDYVLQHIKYNNTDV